MATKAPVSSGVKSSNQMVPMATKVPMETKVQMATKAPVQCSAVATKVQNGNQKLV